MGQGPLTTGRNDQDQGEDWKPLSTKVDSGWNDECHWPKASGPFIKTNNLLLNTSNFTKLLFLSS